MAIVNKTTIDEFILLGLTSDGSVQLLLFGLFLIIYIFSILSNLSMIILIRTVRHLNTPMYFLLSHLSFVDLCYSSTITPKMLSDLISDKKVITFTGCAIQMFLFAMFATSECFLVTAMAYDRYVAICRPLIYYLSMNRTTCWCLVLSSYFSSFLASITHTITVFSFPLCGSNKINHFYCDIPPLLKLACAASHSRKYIVFFLSLVMGIVSFFVILMSYVSIIWAILGTHTSGSRSKAFSTCASHLTVVILFYSTVFGIYFNPSLDISSSSINMIFSIFYTVASPLLNPLIYSFKNADVKRAVMKILHLWQVRP